MRPAFHDTSLFLELSELLLRGDKQVRFRAAGFSMHPTIQDGDLVWVASVSRDRIQVGNIVLYQAGGVPVVHRVVGIRKFAGRTVLTLRGDACGSPDAPVEGGQVLGKVLAIQRGDRFLEVGARHAQLTHRARLLARRLKRRILSVSPSRRILAG
jgi:signal peptidase I